MTIQNRPYARYRLQSLAKCLCAAADLVIGVHYGEPPRPLHKERLIEVKTTNGAARTPFFMTRNEMAVASERAEHWHLYRVHLFAQQPRIYRVRPQLDSVLNLNPETWRASPMTAGAGAT